VKINDPKHELHIFFNFSGQEMTLYAVSQNIILI